MSLSGFPEPWGVGFDGDIPCRTVCSKVFHSLQLSSCRSLYWYTSSAGRNFSHDGWVKHWWMVIAECYILLLCSFNITVVFGLFFHRSFAYPVSISWLPRTVPSHGLVLESNHILVAYTHKLCGTVALMTGHHYRQKSL